MPKPDRAQIEERLRSQLGYGQAGARSASEKLLKLQSKIKSAFEHWWDFGEVQAGLEVEGIRIEWLMQKRGFNPVASLLILDWLLRDPAEAKKALEAGIK